MFLCSMSFAGHRRTEGSSVLFLVIVYLMLLYHLGYLHTLWKDLLIDALAGMDVVLEQQHLVSDQINDEY